MPNTPSAIPPRPRTIAVSPPIPVDIAIRCSHRHRCRRYSNYRRLPSPEYFEACRACSACCWGDDAVAAKRRCLPFPQWRSLPVVATGAVDLWVESALLRCHRGCRTRVAVDRTRRHMPPWRPPGSSRACSSTPPSSPCQPRKMISTAMTSTIHRCSLSGHRRIQIVCGGRTVRDDLGSKVDSGDAMIS